MNRHAASTGARRFTACSAAAGRAPRPWAALVLGFVAALVLAPSSFAADGDADLGAGDLSAIRQVLVARPVASAPLSVAAGSGYGYTGAVLHLGDSHQRLLGALALEGAPLPWLSLGLRFDGRYDHHSFAAATGLPSDDGWIGEPLLSARADRQLRPDLDGSLQASVLVPGSDAPSLRASAITPQLVAALAWHSGRLHLGGTVGYRLDRSRHSVNDYDQLSPGDRLALGVSSFDAVLLGASGHLQAARWDLFGELGWDLLIGGGAPGPGSSPARVAAGARRALTRTLTAEAEVIVSPSGRPAVGPMRPAVPVEPRASLLAGLVLALGRPAPPPVVRVAPPVVIPRASLVVSLDVGQALPLDARVELEQDGVRRPLRLGADGRFSLEGAAPGRARLLASAAGYEDTSADVDLAPGRATAIDLSLSRRLPPGQIRGTVRSFRGKGLPAQVHVQLASPETGAPAGPWDLRCHEGAGTFQVDVPPGTYAVTIEAEGYASQSRTVTVERRGVTVLNVDLRTAP